EVVLCRARKRIQFDSVSSLFLGLIEFADINDDTRQQFVRSGIRGRKFLRALQFGKTIREFPLGKRANTAEGRMRLRQHRRDCDRSLSILARFRPRRFTLAAEISTQSPRFGTLGVGKRVIGIESDSLIVLSNRSAIVLEVASQY